MAESGIFGYDGGSLSVEETFVHSRLRRWVIGTGLSLSLILPYATPSVAQTQPLPATTEADYWLDVTYGMAGSAIGNGAVTVVDVRNSKELPNPKGLQLENIRLSILQGGDRYDLTTHQLLPQSDKLATVGHEYGAVQNPVNSGVFSRNTRLKDFITFDLIDNKAADIAVSYFHQGPGRGFELKFSKDQLSRGYWQYLDGLKDNSSAANIRLDIKPVHISIE